MTTCPETTLQQFYRVKYQRRAIQGVLRHRLHRSPEQCQIVGVRADVQHCTRYLLQYASAEHQLRYRLQRKLRQAAGQPLRAPVWRLQVVGEGLALGFDLAEPVMVVGCTTM